jgi:hypothetical protein
MPKLGTGVSTAIDGVGGRRPHVDPRSSSRFDGSVSFCFTKTLETCDGPEFSKAKTFNRWAKSGVFERFSSSWPAITTTNT